MQRCRDGPVGRDEQREYVEPFEAVREHEAGPDADRRDHVALDFRSAPRTPVHLGLAVHPQGRPVAE